MTRLTEPAIFALVFWIVVWACVARAESATYICWNDDFGNACAEDSDPRAIAAMKRTSDRLAAARITQQQIQLDRIEKMLRAICEHSRHANGMFLNDDCPQEPIP